MELIPTDPTPTEFDDVMIVPPVPTFSVPIVAIPTFILPVELLSRS